ncbi:MAG: prolyl oligopeptidase family serine peptidase [Bacteroidales bacterium]
MKHIKQLTLISLVILFTMNNSNAQLKYPISKKVKQTDDYFGTKVDDPYRWLEDDKSQETAIWVQSQNKLTQDYLANIPYRAKIKQSLTELWNFEKYGLPDINEKYIVYSKNNGIQNQSVVYIQNEGEDNPRVLLDPNQLSKDGTIALNNMSISHNGKYIAYTIARSGSDWNEIYVINAETGLKLKDKLDWVKFSSVAWKGDGFYYSRYDQPKPGSHMSGKNEFHKVYYHTLGSNQLNDKLIFEDPKFPLRNYGAEITDDERFLILSVTESTSGNLLMVKDLNDKNSKFVQLNNNFDFDYHLIGNIDDDLLILTNKNASHYCLMSFNPKQSTSIELRNMVQETKDVLQTVTIAGDKLILVYMNNAKSKMEIHGFGGELLKEIELPGIGTVNGVSGKKNYNKAYFSFTSFTQPTSVFKLNTEELSVETLFSPVLPINTDNYVSDQFFYNSKDGEKVSMFIIHKKGILLDGNNPVLLYGYGGFNISLTPSFSISRMFFIENGGVYAIPNLRGGGEYGSEWHKAGTKLQKQNTFDDFIAAAEFLIAKRYTNPSKLAISGGSNGGLLVGACMTQHPELFKVALPAVGVLDMLRYHKFTIGWAWKTDYGSSENEKEFKYLYDYSPLHQLKKGVQYPATFVTTADHDDRVVPAHSFKFMASLQEKQSGTNPVLIRIESKAGHGAGKPTSKAIEEAADVWSFTFYNLGMSLLPNPKDVKKNEKQLMEETLKEMTQPMADPNLKK